MSYAHIVIFRASALAVMLMAGLAPGLQATPPGDAAMILADCEKALNKKLADCCEDFGERADRGVKNIETELKAGKCGSARKKRDTSLNLISKDEHNCILKLGELGAKCGADLDKAIDDPEELAAAHKQREELLQGVAETLTDCYGKERKRIRDAYSTGAAEAGCDDDSEGAD